MRIPYNRTRTFSTAELPGVICDPVLQFEFLANPSFELIRDLANWISEPDWNETRRLAAELLQSVTTPDGSRYTLGDLETIDELAGQTDRHFIGNLLNGWHTRISLERMAEVKKNGSLSAVWSETDAESEPALD